MNTIDNEEFVRRARLAHGDYYDYSRVNYKSSHGRVIILCPVHGEFRQLVVDHWDGHGCKKCHFARQKTWTEQDDEFLRLNYVSKGAQYCAKSINKTLSAVWSRGYFLKLRPRGTHHKPRYKDIPNSRWSQLLRHAEEKGRIVEIDREFVWDLYLKQGKKCALTGWDILFDPHPQKTTASVDRIDSKLGYTKDNVQLIHKLVNRAKVNYDELDFYAMCKAVHEYRKDDFETWEQYWEWDVQNDTEHPRRRRALGRPEVRAGFTEEDLFGPDNLSPSLIES